MVEFLIHSIDYFDTKREKERKKDRKKETRPETMN